MRAADEPRRSAEGVCPPQGERTGGGQGVGVATRYAMARRATDTMASGGEGACRAGDAAAESSCLTADGGDGAKCARVVVGLPAADKHVEAGMVAGVGGGGVV